MVNPTALDIGAIKELYKTNPVVATCWRYVLLGECTQEQALIAMVVILAGQNQELNDALYRVISNSTSPTVI